MERQEKKYIGVKILKDALLMQKAEYCNRRGWTVPNDEDPEEFGYMSTYEGGYVSWLPKAVFEYTYKPLMGMTFEMALSAVKKGYKIARDGWNRRNQWVSMTIGKTLDIQKDTIWTKHVQQAAKENGGEVEIQPYLSLKNAQGKIAIGWVPSVGDLFAEDWNVID